MRYIKMALLGCVCIASLAFGQAHPAAQPVHPAAHPVAQPVQPAAQAAVSQEAAGAHKTVDAAAVDEPKEVVSGDSAQVMDIAADESADSAKSAGEAAAQEESAKEEEPAAVAESAGSGPKTVLGVLLLESATGPAELAVGMTKTLIENLNAMGRYEMYYPDDISSALERNGERTPAGCRDPRCVNDIGKAIGALRMIYGSIDKNDERYGVRLEMMNVKSGGIETVSVEGAPGVPAKDVLAAALARVHGDESATANLSKYYGPPINNIVELLWSTVAVQGVGIFYTLINYGVGGSEGSRDMDGYTGYNKNEKLSGIYASSNQIPVFARPAALANAYTAVSDDAYGVLYNPAGMAWVTKRDAVIAYQSRFGMDLIAASYANRATRELGFGQAILMATDRDGAMTEMYFVSAFGYKFNQDYLFGPVSVGASVKFMGNTVRALSPDSPYGQSYGAGLDLGAMWELSKNIRYGLLLRDLPSANMWKNRTTGERYSESQPATLHMGGSYKPGYSAFLTADGQIPIYADQPWVMAGGIEYEFFRMLALRIGLQREILNDDAGWWKITCGAGFKFGVNSGRDMSLDLAYEYNTLDLFPVINVSVKAGF
ncbi:MAG: UPF0164 family protein [Chitinispirillia bacterium]|nr:UPF0164 family protein [Chitinispirillia bacterium]MCL2240901.1 UPF0164 family protein [Chitinispirillia bacterium]